MLDTELLDEIREANLAYLLLAQRLLRQDRAEALYRLGVSDEVADLLAQLSTAQLLRIATSSQLMCRFRCDDRLVRSYRLYLEQCVTLELEPALSITRAWRLVKFVEAGMLKLAPCTRCGGHFVVREGDLTRHYVCGLCNVPARAGRTRAARLAEAA